MVTLLQAELRAHNRKLDQVDVVSSNLTFKVLEYFLSFLELLFHLNSFCLSDNESQTGLDFEQEQFDDL